MRRHYILVEGVNLYENIYDTDQLSVIRGGSDLFKTAIQEIKTHFVDKTHELIAVSTGASSGLFYSKVLPEEKEASDLKSRIYQRLNEDKHYRHLTFVVEYCVADNVLLARRQLIRQLRFSQLGGLNIAPDSFDDNHSRHTQADQVEGTRIAAKNTQRIVQSNNNEKKQLSLSVFRRLLHGRTSKQTTQDKAVEYQFAQDINQLCELSESIRQDYPAAYRLNHKMAVIYADGNRFSTLERTYVEQQIKLRKDSSGVSALQDFDKHLQNKRDAFRQNTEQWLLDLNNELSLTENNASQEKHPVLRMETLLWGGDEMLFVVPAWLGMTFLQRFFDDASQWTLPDSTQVLTHAAGIVFCQSKTPVRLMRDLAEKLANRVKDQHGRKANGWDYMILESIDYPASDKIEQFFQQHYPAYNATRPGALCYPYSPKADIAGPHVKQTTAFQQLRTPLDTLLGASGLPPRQLHQIIGQYQLGPVADHELEWESLCDSQEPEQMNRQQVAERRMFQVISPSLQNSLQHELPALTKQWFNIDMDKTAERLWLWLHLLELRDYWRPLSEVTPVNGEPS